MILFAYIDCMSFSSRAEERVVQLCWWWFRIRSANIHVPLDMKALTYLLCLIMPYSNTECPTLFGGIICLAVSKQIRIEKLSARYHNCLTINTILVMLTLC